MERLSPDEARNAILGGIEEPLCVSGQLDLSKSDIPALPNGLQCYDLDASNTRIRRLPDDLLVQNRLILDNCKLLEELPAGLRVGSISLRACNSLHGLPEGLDTWFLDLSECRRFEHWPATAKVTSGHVILRNCISLQSLPDWLSVLSQLDVAGCILLSGLPEGLKISSWLDIGGSGIRSLPPSLQGVSLRWRGVLIDERIAFRPETITAKETLQQENAEIRRVMIERMGYLKFAQEADAAVLDIDTDPGGERKLLRIELEEDEPLVGLFCRCPSTERQYFLRVPPGMKSCHQAAAWMAGFDDPDLYQPIIET